MIFTIRFSTFFLALSATVTALQPNPTRPLHQLFNTANRWTPLPTPKPEPAIQVMERDSDPAHCGYITGNSNNPFTCGKASSCVQNSALSWFGCCSTGPSSLSSGTDCRAYTACVGKGTSVSGAKDWLTTSCTASNLPSCATLYRTFPGGGGAKFSHFICMASTTSMEVLETATVTSGHFSTSSRNSTVHGSTTTSVRSKSSTASRPGSLTSSGEVESSSVAVNTTTAMIETGSSTTVVQSSSQTKTAAAARRTAETMVGILGGIVGVVGLVL